MMRPDERTALRRRAGAIGIIPVTPQKPRFKTIDEQIAEAVLGAVNKARLDALEQGVILSESEKVRLGRDTERMLRATLRQVAGQTREQKRRLRQIKAGTLKGPAVSLEARFTATGLHPAEDLSVIAKAGE